MNRKKVRRHVVRLSYLRPVNILFGLSLRYGLLPRSLRSLPLRGGKETVERREIESEARREESTGSSQEDARK